VFTVIPRPASEDPLEDMNRHPQFTVAALAAMHIFCGAEVDHIGSFSNLWVAA